jgi:hypothetical protein
MTNCSAGGFRHARIAEAGAVMGAAPNSSSSDSSFGLFCVPICPATNNKYTSFESFGSFPDHRHIANSLQ